MVELQTATKSPELDLEVGLKIMNYDPIVFEGKSVGILHGAFCPSADTDTALDILAPYVMDRYKVGFWCYQEYSEDLPLWWAAFGDNMIKGNWQKEQELSLAITKAAVEIYQQKEGKE